MYEHKRMAGYNHTQKTWIWGPEVTSCQKQDVFPPGKQGGSRRGGGGGGGDTVNSFFLTEQKLDANRVGK